MRKRPWYLVLALLGALAFGFNGACRGWGAVSLYREGIDVSAVGQGISNEGDRAALVAGVEGYLAALDAAKSRGWPLAIATLLLGCTTFFFAMRAVGGSGGARVALVQMLVAQACTYGVAHWLLRDVDEAELAMSEAALQVHEHARDKVARPEENYQLFAQVLRARNTVALAFEMVGSGLVVLGLTRRRSRDFFESASAAVEER